MIWQVESERGAARPARGGRRSARPDRARPGPGPSHIRLCIYRFVILRDLYREFGPELRDLYVQHAHTEPDQVTRWIMYLPFRTFRAENARFVPEIMDLYRKL